MTTPRIGLIGHPSWESTASYYKYLHETFDGVDNEWSAALDAGANDYVTKPFSMKELEARIRVVLRGRAVDADDPSEVSLSCGSIALDLVHRELSLDGVNVALTTKEFEVLVFLARNARKTCTHQMILSAVWGAGYGAEAQ